jgi:2-dehydro-3-deoxy-L-rhamnonate dehydrogenase (NAD+)
VNRIDLSSRRAVITGGAQGIGRATAERFLASGAAVSLWDVDPQMLQATAAELSDRGTVHTAVVDVTNVPQVDAAAIATVTALGGIDILVANAGIAGPNHTTWEYPIDQWRQVIDINLMGVYHCCRAVVPLMLAQKYGRIVTISSIAGKEGNPNASAYSASKAGVIALTKSLGKELAAENIAVNCITPAAARTRIFDQLTQAHIDYMLSRIPRGRFVTPGEVAALIAWVASEDNSFTTGAVFDISGGRATY